MPAMGVSGILALKRLRLASNMSNGGLGEVFISYLIIYTLIF